MGALNTPQTDWPLMMNDQAFFTFDKLGYVFPDNTVALHDINWQIAGGAFHCLVGRSGCGKTTLLKLAAGLIRPTTGQVRMQEQPVLGPSQDVGFVFQTPALLEWLSVIDNILLPISLHRTVTPEDKDRGFAVLESVGIASLATRYPRQLSGGQQSRAALARALLPAPSALLMDEPFAALDAITREELQDDLLGLVAFHRTSVVFVTHDITEAVYLGDQVVLMEQGRISQVTEIDLAVPRLENCRYEPSFAHHCQSIRSAMADQRMPDQRMAVKTLGDG